jgi:hypothetical protein
MLAGTVVLRQRVLMVVLMLTAGCEVCMFVKGVVSRLDAPHGVVSAVVG